MRGSWSYCLSASPAYTGLQKAGGGAAPAFASPWLIGMICLTGGPILFTIITSFTRYDVLSPARYVGWQNYRDLLTDDIFFQSLWNTAYMLLRLPLVMGVGLIIAMLLDRSIRGIGAYRTAFFMPSDCAGRGQFAAVADAAEPEFRRDQSVLGADIFDTAGALVGGCCQPDRGPSRRYSRHPDGWRIRAGASRAHLDERLERGRGMIIWLAGLQSIPRQLYEAAAIDGAGAWGRFVNVTLPMLSPYILFNAVVGMIATMQIFTEAYIMTQGGPADSTNFYAYQLFRSAFQYFRMGYASGARLDTVPDRVAVNVDAVVGKPEMGAL